jgi:putative aldouronate transport system permease protein
MCNGRKSDRIRFQLQEIAEVSMIGSKNYNEEESGMSELKQVAAPQQGAQRTQVHKTRTRQGAHQVWRGLVRDKYLYLIALPMLLYFLVFKYVPMWGVLIAFKDYTPYVGFWNSPWVGLQHFERFFSNEDFLILLRNTLAINILSLILFFPLPILLSVMLNEVRVEWLKKTMQSIIYLPHFLSWVVTDAINLGRCL